jgi:hypothetical protein
VTLHRIGVQYLYMANLRSTYSTCATLSTIAVGVELAAEYVYHTLPVTANLEILGVPATCPGSTSKLSVDMTVNSSFSTFGGATLANSLSTWWSFYIILESSLFLWCSDLFVI